MKPGYSEDGDQVVLRMSMADWQMLLIALGYATAAATQNRSEFRIPEAG